ncbi:MAG: SOS response-associated peptidase [Bacteroidia bacterium]|nr:SOS response-associated peptidase [Bacteroidia bacterium]
MANYGVLFLSLRPSLTPLLQKIPHHRSPVVLPTQDEARWLSDLPLEQVLSLLRPYPADEMNAYPIDKAIKSPKAQGPHLMQALGPPLAE